MAEFILIPAVIFGTVLGFLVATAILGWTGELRRK